MHQYTYSIIIPHKNIPDLLQRCLDSIPQREDVQVIIVDDNSSLEKVDFTNFPGFNRPNTEVYFDKTDKGAGRARNVGLKHAKGEWIIFADADDFFDQDFGYLMDCYSKRNEDVIYFNIRSVMNDDITQESNRYSFLNNSFKEFEESKNEHIFRFGYDTPWGKFYKKNMIVENDIHFDEIKYSNDEYFSTCVGCCAKSILVINRRLYVLTTRRGSLADRYLKKRGEENTRIWAAIHSQSALNRYNIGINNQYAGMLNSLLQKGNKASFLRFFFNLYRYNISARDTLKFVSLKKHNKLMLFFLHCLFSLCNVNIKEPQIEK